MDARRARDVVTGAPATGVNHLVPVSPQSLRELENLGIGRDIEGYVVGDATRIPVAGDRPVDREKNELVVAQWIGRVEGIAAFDAVRLR